MVEARRSHLYFRETSINLEGTGSRPYTTFHGVNRDPEPSRKRKMANGAEGRLASDDFLNCCSIYVVLLMLHPA